MQNIKFFLVVTILLRYDCKAKNVHGSARETFEVKVGRLPESPQIIHLNYTEGALILAFNESHYEPLVDMYRLNIADDERSHLFNKSSGYGPGNSTYEIKLNLAAGEHRMNFIAHNPLGWSEYSRYYFLTVAPNVPNCNRALVGSWILSILCYWLVG